MAMSVDEAGADPILVEIMRGSGVESRHRGAAVIATAGGSVIESFGDFEQPVFPRSAIKPIQVLPFVESGALEAFGLGEAELALACASHTAEPEHLRIAEAWLARLGLDETVLDCGPLRTAQEAETGRIGSGSPLGNNCSGKHLGMITTALHRGEPVQGYIRPEHPVQQRILGVLEQVTAQDLGGAPRGIDGCSVPVVAVPLGALATAMARLCEPERHLPARRAIAARRVLKAWAGHPHLIGGTGIFDTRVVALTGGKVLVKRGAEGVLCGCVPDLGLGLAVKITDGAGRAAAVVMAALLDKCGALDTCDPTIREELLSRTMRNAAGRAVGVMRPVNRLIGPEL